ncbi:hypothetical protein GEV33_008949 [Tenebrio molitor]|uniref:Uncharacterized protein n=1 Tax=Tenebrio molitor TaxID=7067 RepID=A0A8J6HGL9_TENMO|nr:hypothetical protein GEV33_008949 [Tenebrio molitor]
MKVTKVKSGDDQVLVEPTGTRLWLLLDEESMDTELAKLLKQNIVIQPIKRFGGICIYHIHLSPPLQAFRDKLSHTDQVRSFVTIERPFKKPCCEGVRILLQTEDKEFKMAISKTLEKLNNKATGRFPNVYLPVFFTFVTSFVFAFADETCTSFRCGRKKKMKVRERSRTGSGIPTSGTGRDEIASEGAKGTKGGTDAIFRGFTTVAPSVCVCVRRGRLGGVFPAQQVLASPWRKSVRLEETPRGNSNYTLRPRLCPRGSTTLRFGGLSIATLLGRSHPPGFHRRARPLAGQPSAEDPENQEP